MNSNEIDSLNAELRMLQFRIDLIRCELALNNNKESNRVTFGQRDTNKEKLFNTSYQCPVCYEFLARKGQFYCKHKICACCFSRLIQKTCPICRAVAI